MVEAISAELKLEEKLSIPPSDVEGKENIDAYFKLMLAGTPHLKFSITDNEGKELYANMLSVEMR
ncbi:MAG: hypothetical protein ACXABO_04355 [Promethearchaeota archaeon]|jgi:hypothetical protein